MSDFVRREDVITVLCFCEETKMMLCKDLRKILEKINDIPSAEPEVIYCKDCKYSHMTIDGLCKYCDIWFPNEEMYEDGNHFCASAEKR